MVWTTELKFCNTLYFVSYMFFIDNMKMAHYWGVGCPKNRWEPEAYFYRHFINIAKAVFCKNFKKFFWCCFGRNMGWFWNCFKIIISCTNILSEIHVWGELGQNTFFGSEAWKYRPFLKSTFVSSRYLPQTNTSSKNSKSIFLYDHYTLCIPSYRLYARK